MNYFEFNERRTQGSVAVDLVEWPGIVVTETEPNDDQLLEFSLQAGPVSILKQDGTE